MHISIVCFAIIHIRVVTRYMGSGIKGLKRAGIRDQSPGIWDHNTWDRDQQCFMESGIRLTTKTGSGVKILIVFAIRDQHFGQKYGISYEKIYLVTTLTHHKQDSTSIAKSYYTQLWLHNISFKFYLQYHHEVNHAFTNELTFPFQKTKP